METCHLCLDWAAECLRCCTSVCSCTWEETGSCCDVLEGYELARGDLDALAKLDRFFREDWDADGWERRLRSLAESYGRSMVSSEELRSSYREYMRRGHKLPLVLEHRVPDTANGQGVAGVSAPSEFWTWGRELAILIHPIVKRIRPESPLTAYTGPMLFPETIPDVVLLIAGEPRGFGHPSADDIVDGIGDMWEIAAGHMGEAFGKQPRIIRLHSDRATREKVRAVIENPLAELDEMDHRASESGGLLGMIHWVGRSDVEHGQLQALQVRGEDACQPRLLSPRSLAISLAGARDREIQWQFFFLCSYRDSHTQDPIPAPGYAQVLEPIVLQGGVPCALGLMRPVSRACADYLATEFYSRLLMPYCDREPPMSHRGIPEAVLETRRRLYQASEDGTESCYYGWASPVLIMQRDRQPRRSSVDVVPKTQVRAEDQHYIAQCVKRGECCSVVAPFHLGKSSLLRAMLAKGTLSVCADDGQKPPIAVFVDCLVVTDEIALYGWLLDEITLKLEHAGVSRLILDDLAACYEEVLQAHNARAAWFHFAKGMGKLRRGTDLRLLLLLDEFDDAFSDLPPRPFKQLRVLRDAFGARLCFVTATSRSLESIRPEDKMRYFRELFDRCTLFLPPLSEEDSERVLHRLAEDRGSAIRPAQELRLIQLSGGHPGLLRQLYSVFAVKPELVERASAAQLADRPEISGECQSLWDELEEREQEGLRALIRDGELGLEASQRRVLRRKRLITMQRTGRHAVFSPVFEAFVRRESKTGVIHDASTGRILVDGHDVTEDLDPRPREFVRLLCLKDGRVCTYDDIREAVWGTTECVESSAIYITVQRAREVIEPDRENPSYIVNVRGQGYRLETPGSRLSEGSPS
mgnify:CR=1 FL=1